MISDESSIDWTVGRGDGTFKYDGRNDVEEGPAAANNSRHADSARTKPDAESPSPPHIRRRSDVNFVHRSGCMAIDYWHSGSRVRYSGRIISVHGISRQFMVLP